MFEYILIWVIIFLIIGLIIGSIIFIWHLIKSQSKPSDYFDNKINDIENILVILIAHIKDGGILYSKYFAPIQLETEYLHGLISTVNMMAKNIGEKAKLKKLEYDQKIILLNDGKIVRGIVLCKDNPSTFLEDSLTIIVKGFENKFLEELQEFETSNLEKFKRTDKIIEEVFEKILIDAMIVLWTETPECKEILTKEEIDILKIASKLMDKNQFFTLPQLVKMTHKKIKKNMKDALYIIEDLVNRKYIMNYYKQVDRQNVKI
ncbi:MAG: hypothetical protein EAX96_02045 [Candidatus Lokiarchaeota archaeon]|nr:hypothetical protein [Candidatus Lokiarchaeota archaeon]